MTIKTFDPDKINLQFSFVDCDQRSGKYFEPCPLIINEGVISIFVGNIDKHVRTYIETVTSDYELLVTMPDGLVIPVPVELDVQQLNKNAEAGVHVELGGLTTTQFEVTVLANYGQWWVNQTAEEDVFHISDNPMFLRGVRAGHQGVVFCNWIHDYLSKINSNFEQFAGTVHLDVKTVNQIKNCTLVGVTNDVITAIATPLRLTEQQVVGHLIQVGALEYTRSLPGRAGVIKEVSGVVRQPTSFRLRNHPMGMIPPTWN